MDQVKSIKEGNSNSFRKAYYEYHSRLYRYIYKYTRSHYLAEETVQLTFIRIWEKREMLSEQYDLPAQLFRAAKSIVIDLLRKEATHVSSLIPESDSSLGYEYNQQAEHRNEMALVLSEIETLPYVCKKVFKLSRFEGLSHKDIASELSVSPKTVEAHIAKALRHLRNVIGMFF
ncbi:RNA polymerase sigma factor [Filimonas effusa]|uniref:Sigma-70 family RNA polymerase sigma factor n=1 Tax=Filimonas effusa TaxID=2508721 RepID=A0A4Q1D3Z5_9BACT|nr:sigma-70 family RNA polymerase sigma factor [Filimonas effusa]RXK83099.1 sigma-70 family RNA polymerase sigma factor [Filimonas effusa]